MTLLSKMLRGRRALALAALLSCLAASAVTLMWNTQLSGIIDTVSAGRPPGGGALGAALLTMLTMAASAYLKGMLSARACESLSHDLRMGYARHLASLPYPELEGLGAGEQISRLQNEIADVSGFLTGNLFSLIGDGVSFLLTLIYLLCINPALTIASNLPVALIVLYVIYSSRVIRSAVELSQRAKGRMNGWADTLITMFPVIKLYGAARMVEGGYDRAVREWEGHASRAERRRAALMSLSAVLSRAPVIILIWLGGSLAMGGGAVTMGTVYIFLNLSGNVSGVMMNLPGYIASFRQFSANMEGVSSRVLLEERGRRA